MSGEGAGGTDPGSATAAAERTGRAFVRALADKDAAALARLLADDVDFYGMTPARLWRARGARQAIDEVLLVWFEPDDVVQEVVSVEHGDAGGRPRVDYRLLVRNGAGLHLVEQRAYFDLVDLVDDGDDGDDDDARGTSWRIGRMNAVCAGFRLLSS
ncbi:hypothetical protein FHN55_00220 [Streptomyces sp. NP160]|uniref:hypothetical protein n=1 Tax=Streptomyces sp. NP160 TaxID=2586637 RepID=UPI00111B03A8|nr:hypothetical protein [Streptomyces sp. NP160]TNM70167.1 hypothetical protein FHN55_00220 [Streptomyces sp. NP160]